MEQIIIISGNGSIGRTMLATAFASLAKNKVIADCDISAPELHRHLPLKPEAREKHEFIGRRLQRLTDQSAPGADHAKRHINTMWRAMVAGVPVAKSADGVVSLAIKKDMEVCE